MKKWIVVMAGCLLGALRAESAEAPAAAPANVRATMPQPTEESYVGTSLLKATLTSRPDPQQAKLESVSFFAVPVPEPRTMKKHDLVTIIIRELSEFTSDSTTETNKEFDMEAAIEDLVKLQVSPLQISPGGVGDEPLRVRMNGTREFNGEGNVDRADTLIARITAEVIDVKPNGNLVLQARGYIKTDEEEAELVISGTCRAEDVNIDNTILSSQMYDQRIEKRHKGAVRDATKRGWFPRLLDLLNPF